MSAPNRAGLIARRFKALRAIGEGAFGVVYIARDMETNAYVAMKKFRARWTQDGLDYCGIQELRQLSELEHANVVRFVGAFAWRGSMYMATEYLPLSLHALIYARGEGRALPPADAKCLVRMLLEGVAYLHSNRLLHRDIKPENLLLTDGGVLKLIDFGLSTDFPADFGPMICQVATQAYRAPELCFGARRYGAGVDVWAVGCVLAEMLLGRPLLPGRGDFEQLQLIADMFGPVAWAGSARLPGYVGVAPRAPPPPLAATLPVLAPDALDLLAGMLALDPDARVSAADALRHEYFRSPPAATRPADLGVARELRSARPALWLPSAAGVVAGTGCATSRARHAPGTTPLLRAQLK